jgi:putative heme-binding domain-containing protein
MKIGAFSSTFALSVAFAFQVASFAQNPPTDPYRRAALTQQGDVARGAKIFADEQRLACAKCHSIDGSASKAGPDLFAIGDKFGRRDLVEAVLVPSATISPGYQTVVIETKDGDEVQGVLKRATDSALELMNADGKIISIPTAQIKARKGSSVSLMPEGLQTALSPQEFTDLIEYLTTLKQKESTLQSNHGMPSEIPMLAKTVNVRPFFTNQFIIPRTKAQSGLTSFHQIPGSPNSFLVLHQTGVIWKADKSNDEEKRSIFLDLTGKVFYERGPNGLLDLTFHPKFRSNRKYYVKHQIFENETVATIIVEREFNADFTADSGKPGRRLLKIESVAEDHSGGCLQFGPDGFLYIVMGDTGPHNDPNGHAQNLNLLLGKILRIDVDHPHGDTPYSIPGDNPFVGRNDARPEIWAYGFRNPWRFCFDRATGDLWAADVGQDRVEEVDIVHRSENYGWNVYEGFEPFSNQYKKEGRTFTMPVFAYRRKYGNSITGGYVYRGDKNSSFYGVYLCGDYTSKRIFGITQENAVLDKARQIGTSPQSLVSFSEDESGNLYVIGYEGTVYRIDFSTGLYK